MSQHSGPELTLDAVDWTASELPAADASLVAKFDYQELRETLEAIVSSMKAVACDVETLPPSEPTTSS